VQEHTIPPFVNKQQGMIKATIKIYINVKHQLPPLMNILLTPVWY